MKIQTRIALLFTIVCTSVIATIGGIIYYFANENAFDDFYTRLELRAVIAAKANVDPEEQSEAYERVRYIHLQRLPNEREYIVPIDSLQYLASSKSFQTLPSSFFSNLRIYNNASYRNGQLFYKGIRYRTNSGDYAIIISAVHSYALNFLLNLKHILITTTIISIIFLFTIGMLFSRQILMPVRRITQRVNDISATSLHRRLQVKPGKDELAELGHTFNNMLNRLETSFESQNNFVSNASHELNTPLTAILGEADFALSKTRTADQYKQSLQVIVQQAEKLRNITRSLLELAQSGFTGNLSFELIRVSELIENVEMVVRSIYPDCLLEADKSLHPIADNDLFIKGNFHLLELCISNIVLNACKYSNGQKVVLALAVSQKDVIIIIKDSGIGIPEHDMPHIFDPFFRASNVKSSKGYGIGLPLAQNIIKLHQGQIIVRSQEQQGTEVTLRLAKV